MADSNITISDVRFRGGTPQDVARGLLGYVDCVVNHTLKLSGLALRRTRRGELRLSFPAKRDANGQERYPVRPIHDDARQELESRIIDALVHWVG